LNIAILNYKAGNVYSMQLALERIGCKSLLTADPEQLIAADKVIIPGVGAAAPAMQHLKSNGLDVVIKNLTQPVLGVCLGLQIMCKESQEDHTQCLGIFPVSVERFKLPKKIPHIGWNTIFNIKSSIFSLLNPQESVYFVHSYRAGICDGYTVAECEYGELFSAALQKDNFYATQFHPEKSGTIGESILRSFVSL
jgi:glutamine amidotransferase